MEDIMVILIGGSSHTGKTLLAHKLVEKYHYSCLSLDHLKMGLIRSKYTTLTPYDDDKMTDYLWPIVSEMIKTAIENEQNLIVEGCYIPFNWRQDLEERYLSYIDFICLAMTEGYIECYFDDIIGHESEIESRLVDTDCSIASLKADNQYYIDGFMDAGENVVMIEDNYEKTLKAIVENNLH
jgi:gluconate kinase